MQGIAPPEDQLAARLRGFGPLGLLAIAVILFGDVVVKPVSAVLVLVWTWRSNTPWREIGYVRPKTWIGSLTIGVSFGVAFKFLMKALVMPLLGADHRIEYSQAAITGLVFGTIFAVTGQLWMLMCAHAAYDLTAVAIIYWNIESDVAHFIFG